MAQERMISFIFPAYNEAENLKRFPTEVIPVFDALGKDYEIVVVDDGSRKDNTAEVARTLGPKVRLIQHVVNKGLGAAIRTGIAEAKGDIVITMDTDLTFAPSLVKDLLARFEKGDVDVVSGSPKLAGYGKEIPSYRVFMSHMATLVYRIVMGANVSTVSPIFRLYKREQLLQLPLQAEKFDINAEILFFLLRDGRRVAEIPAPLTHRIHGESNLDYKKEMVRHLKLIWRMVQLRFRGSSNTPLILVTQAVDPMDSAVGFFCEWITEFAAQTQGPVSVWCLRAAPWVDCPSNVSIVKMPKGKLSRCIWFAWRALFVPARGIFIHMTPIWALVGGWAFRLRCIPLVLWYTHGNPDPQLRLALLLGTRVLTATANAFPFRSSNVTAVGHGVGAAFGSVSRSPQTQGARILANGRITPRKAVAETLEFFSAIHTVDPSVRLTWVGSPQTESDIRYAEEMRLRVNTLGLDGCVVWAGSVPYAELPRINADADLLLHLSKTGSLDKVVLEALASGCPVFSTNPATAEALRDAYWGKPLDAAAAHEAVRRANAGVPLEERNDIRSRYSLAQLIGRILHELHI